MITTHHFIITSHFDSFVQVLIKSSGVSIQLASTGEEIFAGPFQGKVLASESAWALFDGMSDTSLGGGRGGAGGSFTTRGPRITLSLEKTYDSRDIWATVISKQHLLQTYGVSIFDMDDDDDDGDDNSDE